MDHVTNALSIFLDGELPETERLRVESHLGQCSSCRAERDDLKSISSLVGGLKDKPLPAGFIGKLKSRRHAAAMEPPWLAPRLAMALAFPCLALFFIVHRMAAPKQEALDAVSIPPERAASVNPPERAALYKAGQPFGAPPEAPKPRYTNEMLHAAQEREKARMGIVKMLPPQRSAAEMQWRRAQRSGALRLAGTAGASVLASDRPELLAANASGGSLIAPSVEPESFLQAGPIDEGVAARSQGELTELWRRLNMRGSPPSVDFSRDMLVIILAGQGQAPLEIADIVQSEGRLRVKYRAAVNAGPEALYPYRVVPLSNLPLQFEKLP